MHHDKHFSLIQSLILSERELERGDREVWGAVGDNQIGITHPSALPVKYGYDTVLDKDCDNAKVRFMPEAMAMSNTDLILDASYFIA